MQKLLLLIPQPGDGDPFIAKPVLHEGQLATFSDFPVPFKGGTRMCKIMSTLFMPGRDYVEHGFGGSDFSPEEITELLREGWFELPYGQSPSPSMWPRQ